MLEAARQVDELPARRAHDARARPVGDVAVDDDDRLLLVAVGVRGRLRSRRGMDVDQREKTARVLNAAYLWCLPRYGLSPVTVSA